MIVIQLLTTFIYKQSQAAWANKKAQGFYDNKKWNGWRKHKGSKASIPCEKGYAVAVKGDADQTYKCKNIVSACIWILP